MDRRHFITGLTAAFLPLPAHATHAPTGYIRTNWSRDPFALGAYSYVTRGAQNSDRKALAAPVADRIFFAGEACHPNHSSTVHSAHESGLIAAQQLSDTKAQRVAVIGAGIAGLTAAQALAAKGRDVTVIEARGRIGGRIWTDRSRLGAPLDLGASWIHGARGNPISRLADRVGAQRVATRSDYIIRGGDGGIMRDRDAHDWLDDVTEVQHSAGADRNQLNLSAYNSQGGYGGAEQVFPGGYAPLLSGLGGNYRTQLSASVRRISLEGTGVTLGLTSGNKTFDAVVVTVPLGVLKAGKIRFVPALPQSKREAIARLGMGLLDKLYLRFNSVFWDDATWILTPETGLPPGQFNQWLNLHKLFGLPILLAFNGGSPAFELAKLGDTAHVKRATQALNRAYR